MKVSECMRAKVVVMLIILGLLAGCASPSLKFGVSSTADINRNEYGEPLAVVVPKEP